MTRETIVRTQLRDLKAGDVILEIESNCEIDYGVDYMTPYFYLFIGHNKQKETMSVFCFETKELFPNWDIRSDDIYTKVN